MNNELNWDHLRYFVEVTEAGSVVGAAKSLGVSHATVLRNISRLEQNLGLTLFDHHQSGYRITTAGEEIFASAVAMREQAETLLRLATGKNPTPEGLLRLVVPDGSLFDLMPLVRVFRDQYPLIHLVVQTEVLPGKNISQFEADVTILITNTPPDNLIGRQLTRISFGYFACDAYVGSKQQKPLRPGDCEWITWGTSALSESDLGANWQESILRRFSRRPDVVLRTTSHHDALAAVRAGVGVGLLAQGQERLVELPFRPAIDPIGVWMLTHQDLRRSGRIRAFMDFMVSQFLAT